MCGDLEEEETEAQRLYGNFLHLAQTLVHDLTEHRGAARARLDTPEGEISDSALHGYMDGLFADVLGACIKDGRRVSEAQRYRVLSDQAVVLSRLAGFLAGNLDLREDPMRMAASAMLSGYDPQELHGGEHGAQHGHARAAHHGHAH